MITVDFGAWPLVLCGPMLRRVEANQVSVFVALRFRRRVTLNVYSCNPDGTPAASLGSATAITRRLGRRLHVTVVTVTGLALVPTQFCAYDMQFDPDGTADAEDVNPASKNLKTLGLLEGSAPLGYLSDLLPTFLAPAADANALEFVHASCRKLHGEGVDMLPYLDTLLSGLRTERFKRPQVLFLTGDQIYADDVAAPLLPVLTAVGHALLGWTRLERMPIRDVLAEVSGCLPGLRGLVTQAGALTSGEAACHLLSLGEFYAMYLMAWSDSVWPRALPELKEVYTIDMVPGGLLPRSEVASLDRPELLAIRAREFILDGTEWRKEAQVLLQVKAGLPAVRRALANIPTLMMFDDHEVTDDWNQHRGWQQDVHGNAVGRRIMSNALFAYSAFQSWGNDPSTTFTGTAPGAKLLDALELIGNLDGMTYSESSPAVAAAMALVRVGLQSFPDGLNWDYALERSGYRVLVLDTRTHRDLTRDGQAPLMTSAEMDRQITARISLTSKPLTIVLSPAPVIGHPFVERIVQATGGRFGYASTVDLESWWSETRPEALEALLDRLSQCERVVLISGDVHYAFSASVRYWNDRPGKTVRACLVQLVSSALKNEAGMTRFLGGAGSLRQQNELKAVDKALDVGALIGRSYARVKGFPVPHVLRAKRPSLESVLVPPAREDTVGWTSGPVDITLADGSHPPPVTGTPAVHVVSTTPESASAPPVWRYRIGFSSDLRYGRGTPIRPVAVPSSGERFIDRKLRQSREWRVQKDDDCNRVVVGTNNLARVSVFGEPPHLAVRQEFWFRRGKPPTLPFTEHYIDLDPPIADEASPLQPTPLKNALPDLSIWAELMSRRPPAALQDKVLQLARAVPRSWYFHHIESGWGPINLDWYAVRIDALPRRMPGDPPGTDRLVGRTELFQYVRRKLVEPDVIVSSLYSRFEPYEPSDGAAWAGTPAEALGALIHIGIPANAGTVMTTDSADDTWTFSTLKTPRDGAHPVSGNRRFEIMLADDSKTYLLTMGSDRCTDRTTASTPALELVWFGADRLWRSFQAKAVDLIRSLDGVAEAVEPISRRYDWSHVMSGYFGPTTAWRA